MLCLVFRTHGRHKFKADSVGLELRHEGGGAVIETGKGACKLSQVFIELEDNKYE